MPKSRHRSSPAKHVGAHQSRFLFSIGRVKLVPFCMGVLICRSLSYLLFIGASTLIMAAAIAGCAKAARGHVRETRHKSAFPKDAFRRAGIVHHSRARDTGHGFYGSAVARYSEASR